MLTHWSFVICSLRGNQLQFSTGSMDLLYTPSHRQNITYHRLWYTRHGTLVLTEIVKNYQQLMEIKMITKHAVNNIQ